MALQNNMKILARCIVVQILIMAAKGQIDPKPTQNSCRPISDVVFLLDGSDSISDDEFLQQKLLLQKFVQHADIGPDTVRVGIVVVSSVVGDVVSLAARGNKTVLLSAIESLKQAMEGSRTDLGLVEMEQMFGTSGRPGVVKVGVVLTDGRAKFERATIGEANVVKNAGVFLVAIGVGRMIQFSNLETMASTRGNAYPILPLEISAKMLIETVKFLGQETCTGHALLDELATKAPHVDTRPRTPVHTQTPRAQPISDTGAPKRSIPSRQNPVVAPPAAALPNEQLITPQRSLFEPMSVLSSFDFSALEKFNLNPMISPMDLRSANFTLISRELAKDAAQVVHTRLEPTVAPTESTTIPTTTTAAPTTTTTATTTTAITTEIPLKTNGQNRNLAVDFPIRTPSRTPAGPTQQLGPKSPQDLYKILNMNSFKFEGKPPASLIGQMPESTIFKIQSQPKANIPKDNVVDLPKQNIASLPTSPALRIPERPVDGVPNPALVNLPTKSPNKRPTKPLLNLSQQALINMVKQPGSNPFKNRIQRLPKQNINGQKAPVYVPTTQSPGGETLSPYVHGIHRELAAHQCSQARNIDGVGYTFHPKSCTEFLQCFHQDGNLRVEIGKCPFETFFDEELAVCRYHKETNCFRDPCKDTDVISYKHSDNCRAYWDCGRGQSAPRCCPLGSSYSPGYGCTRNTTCKDMCMDFGNLKQVISASKCKLLGMDSNPKYYFESVAGVGWVIRTCPYGSRFDQSSCTCRLVMEDQAMTTNCNPELYLDFKDGFQDKSGNGLSLGNTNVDIESGTGVFDGTSLLTLWRFSGVSFGQTVTITFRFRLSVSAPKGQLMHLVSNCCYGCSRIPAPSIDIAVIPGHNGGIGVFSAKTETAGEVFVYVPYEDTITGWNRLTYSYNGRVLTGRVNAAKNSKQIIGDIVARSDPLIIGACDKTGAFQGFMDEVKLYLCDI